ncbi:MAG: LytTR family DNA-binding domain-containing protein [Arachidicoccus sp.]|nr:LytTR family DNA-binding domain-containing protein [Arachidicoccus sp.]
MLKCVIIDDEQPAINVLKNYISKTPALELAATATNPINGMELIKDTSADVVFLDIQMDEMTGIEVKSMLDAKVQVIFCTAYSEFAVKSYDLNAIDYLMKPISFPRFMRAVEKIKGLDRINKDSQDTIVANDYIFVKTETKGKMIRVDLDEIDFAEARGNYVAIHNGSRITLVYSTLHDFENELPGKRFMRVHKSYIIAVDKVAQIAGNTVTLKNRSEQIPLSRTYKEAFLKRIHKKPFERN